MILIMSQVIPDQSVLSALEMEKLNFSSLFGIYPPCKPVLLSTQVSDIGPSWSSCLSIVINLKVTVKKKKKKKKKVYAEILVRKATSVCHHTSTFSKF